MTIVYEPPVAAPPQSALATADASPRRKRQWRGGNSVLAFGEPLVWLTGGGLLCCVVMIVGLLLLVLYQGISTFWPLAVVQVQTTDDHWIMGEVSRDSTFELNYGGLPNLSPTSQATARRLLNQQFHAAMAAWVEDGLLGRRLAELSEPALRAAERAVELTPPVRDAAGRERSELLTLLDRALRTSLADGPQRLETQVRQALEQDTSGKALDQLWTGYRTQQEAWLTLPELDRLAARLRDDAELAYQVWADYALSLLANEVAVPMHRRLFRTGNFELTNEHFTWISQFEVAAEEQPAWAVVFERLSWGRFYGLPKTLLVDGQPMATEPAGIWQQFERYHPEVRARWHQRRRLEIQEVGEINRRLEHERLALRQVELQHGQESAAWQAAEQGFQKQNAEL
jgi:ABC-type phosphate transport system auxiliary subunit